MSFTQVTLAGKYADVQGNPLSGTVSFTLSFPITDGTTIITPSAKSVVLDSTGSFSIVLDATDDPTTSPSGATYTVVENVGSFSRSYAITLSHAQTSQELASIAPAVAGPQQFSYLTTTQAMATYLTSVATYFVTSAGSDSNDGTTPTSAFATLAHAVAQAQANYPAGATIQLGYGTFTVPSTVSITTPGGLVIRGCGMGETYDATNNIVNPTHPTTISYTGSSDAFQVEGNSGTTSPAGYGLVMCDLALVGNSGAGNGITVAYAPRIDLYRVAIDEFPQWGLSVGNSYWINFQRLVITRCGSLTNQGGGLFLNGPAVNLVDIKDSIFNYNTGTGAWLYGNTVKCTSSDFSQNISTTAGGDYDGSGVRAENGMFLMVGCWFEGNAGRAGYRVYGSGTHTYVGCHFSNAQWGIETGSTGDTHTVIGCYFDTSTSGYAINNHGVPLSWSGCYCNTATGFIEGASSNLPNEAAAQAGIISATSLSSRYSQTLTAAGAVTIDASTGEIQLVNLRADCTSSTITNATPGQRLRIRFTQDSTGGRTYVWPTDCRFAGNSVPTPSTAAGLGDWVEFYANWDGTLWEEVSRAIGVPTS